MKKQNKKDDNSSFLVILLILAIIVIGVVLCFGWIVGAIWLLFFRKKSNMEPKKLELITASVLTLSIISFVLMVTSLIHSSSVEEDKNTSYVAEMTTKSKKTTRRYNYQEIHRGTDHYKTDSHRINYYSTNDHSNPNHYSSHYCSPT